MILLLKDELLPFDMYILSVFFNLHMYVKIHISPAPKLKKK